MADAANPPGGGGTNVQAPQQDFAAAAEQFRKIAEQSSIDRAREASKDAVSQDDTAAANAAARRHQ